ncbi:hypothetical protein [Acidovorax sp. SUPP3334]|uniref:hypothetical protein n=1 Tax=Acidovorax sp. SUPP3334 TaxID=2920881 RepID=UPI0023DE68A5|nr:hypothetical protein [Acidovorax sp. SUPP3334]GKT20512.1 hypothetical protein AVHM3334_01285 [Acidovorax sp. SUPP3334]
MGTVYHTPYFDPTVDELNALKQLEMGKAISVTDAITHHLSGRLYERGYVAKNDAGDLAITDTGRQLIRRQES